MKQRLSHKKETEQQQSMMWRTEKAVKRNTVVDNMLVALGLAWNLVDNMDVRRIEYSDHKIKSKDYQLALNSIVLKIHISRSHDRSNIENIIRVTPLCRVVLRTSIWRAEFQIYK
jgi:hypothetical protein